MNKIIEVFLLVNLDEVCGFYLRSLLPKVFSIF